MWIYTASTTTFYIIQALLAAQRTCVEIDISHLMFDRQTNPVVVVPAESRLLIKPWEMLYFLDTFLVLFSYQLDDDIIPTSIALNCVLSYQWMDTNTQSCTEINISYGYT